MKCKSSELTPTLIRLLLAGLLVCLMGPISNAIAQGVCIAARLKVTKIAGQVIFPSAKGEEPIPDAVIELSEDNDYGRTIERATADVSGHFDFQNVRPGKYKVTVTAPHLHTLIVRLQVAKSSRKPRRYIRIVLGAKTLEPCGGGYARIQKTKP